MRVKHLRSALNGHAEADRYFEACTPWRTRPNDPRPLQERRNRTMSVRRNDITGDIAFRFHATDVVVWHRDNSFTVTPYKSQSTDVFCNAFTPNNFRSHMAADFIRLYNADGHRFYHTAPTMRFQLKPDGNIEMLSKPVPFTKYRVDRVKIKAARQESGYAAFAAWAKAYEAMMSPTRDDRYWRLPFHGWGRDKMLGMLADKTCWVELTLGFGSVTQCLTTLDTAIKRVFDTFYAEELPYLTGWDEVEAVRRSHNVRC